MGAASLHLGSWSSAWRGLRQKFDRGCTRSDCIHQKGAWHRFSRQQKVLMQQSSYCVEGCLERALADLLRRTQSLSATVRTRHRIPLGLVLLSRQQLTLEQLRAALEAQQTAGRGRIGEWLQTLGFVSEQQVTAALARQWSCPVLRRPPVTADRSRAPQLPVSLLKSFSMIPVDFVPATATLHVAFGGTVDYSVLRAIEQMLECRTEPCMIAPSALRASLQELVDHRGESEVVFNRALDITDFARTVASYCARVSASEIRVASCGTQLWARLLRSSHRPLDLLAS
jgi:hypothetical protein